ncbi:MAG: transglutaminase-like domain-containing protein [Anaerolineales bacterium]|nr:transglutaminase-like domain-containing protein [Anaerolineales bacterium]
MNDLDETTFAEEVQTAGEFLSPVRANLLFAREIAYPDLRPSVYLHQLKDLAEAAARAIGGGDIAARAQALAGFLFQQQGFRGNRAEFNDPRNSFLNEVLTRRLGLPISLSVLFLHIGQQLGLPVQGVGMPGHFIVGVAAEAGPLYLDPFNGGRPLTRGQCLELVQQATGYQGRFDARWLAPTSPRDIVARMLNNLRNVYSQAEDWPHTLSVIERLRELQPEEPAHVRDMGMVLYHLGALRRAAESLTEYLALAPNARDADQVRQSRNLLWDELARQH